MKSFLQSAAARCLSFLLLGIVLITFSTEATDWIVRACGLLFVIPGAVALVSYFNLRKTAPQTPLYPLVGLGCIFFGMVLLLLPALFVQTLMYVLAAILILAGTTQCYTLFLAKKESPRISGGLYLFPVLLILMGLFVIFYWREVAPLPFIIIGSCCIVYALVELWTSLIVYRARKHRTKETAALPEA